MSFTRAKIPPQFIVNKSSNSYPGNCFQQMCENVHTYQFACGTPNPSNTRKRPASRSRHNSKIKSDETIITSDEYNFDPLNAVIVLIAETNFPISWLRNLWPILRWFFKPAVDDPQRKPPSPNRKFYLGVVSIFSIFFLFFSLINSCLLLLCNWTWTHKSVELKTITDAPTTKNELPPALHLAMRLIFGAVISFARPGP